MTIKVKDKIFSGSGVLIIEDYIKQDRKIKSVVLVRNKSSQLFGDFGGMYEKRDKLLQVTASKELKEESRNLIDLDWNILQDQKYVDVISNKKRNEYYRIYIIKINGICRKYFHYNRKIIDKSDLKRYYKETDDIRHISIDDINFDNIKIRMNDIYDKEISLSRRVRNILRNSKNIIKKVSNGKSLSIQNDFKIKSGLLDKKMYNLKLCK
jgi:hypothetical protein